jgi:hypothetical protein
MWSDIDEYWWALRYGRYNHLSTRIIISRLPPDSNQIANSMEPIKQDIDV